jgi:DHA1 family multidrug resistance protein-like MFS transporter
MKTTKKQPVLSPIMRWFMFSMVLANVGSQMFPMLLPIYLTDLGASVGQVGLVFTLTSVSMLILQIFGGWISDTIGRLRAIAIGSVGGIIFYVGMLLAPSWQWMLVALAVGRIPYALVGPSFGAFIAEHSTEENRGKVYGITDTIFQITGVLGPPLGGFLAGSYGFKLMLLVSAILYSSAAVLRIWMATAMRSPEEVAPDKLAFASLKTSIKTIFSMIIGGGIISWIFITDGVRDIAFRLSGELQPLYLEQIAGISIEQIGVLGSIFSIAWMFTPILSGRMSDKYGERVPITLGFLMIFGAYMIFLQANAFLGFAITWMIFGIGVGLLSPAYSSLISKVVPQKMLGTFSGLFQSSIGVISLPAPLLGAQLWERFNPRLPFIITAVSSVVTVIPTWFKFKLPDRVEPPSNNDMSSS